MSVGTISALQISSHVVFRTCPTVLLQAVDRYTPSTFPDLQAPVNDERYTKQILVDTPELLLVAARWRAGAISELHGHSGSAGLYRILSGRIEEERYLPQATKSIYSVCVLQTGDESYLPAGSFHQLRAHEDSITIHAYTPRPDETLSEPTAAESQTLFEARRRRGQNETLSRDSKAQLDPRQDLEIRARKLASDWASYESEAVEAGGYRVPFRILEDMRSSGILAAPLPRSLGGFGASLAETANAVSLIAEHAPAAALALVMPLGNAATCRIPLSSVDPTRVGALRANQRWIAHQISRGMILAVANSEPGAGGSLSSTKTVARTDTDGITTLTGRKSFATIGPDADYFLCAARNVDEASENGGAARIDGCFIHRNAPGLTLDENWNGFGMRTTASVGLELQDTPADAILGYSGCLETVNARHWSTLLFSAVFLGIGRAAIREGVCNDGRSPWARAKLAELALQLNAAAGFLESTCHAEVWPAPGQYLKRVLQVKTFVTKIAVAAATESATLSGGRCYSAGNLLYRLLSDSLAGPLLRPPLASAMDTLAADLTEDV